jgi:hypothetical protein
MHLQDLRDGRHDFEEGQVTCQEGLDGHFVRRVKNGRRGTSRPSSCFGQA